MATALDFITGALRRINSYAPGETLAAADSNDALDTFNDLLDSLSTDEQSMFSTTENIFTFVAAQFQYTIGNYLSANTFTGTITSGSAVITGVTIPSDLVANATQGSDLFSSTIGIPSGAYAISTGINTITMSQQATTTPGVPIAFTFTVPGNFKAPRPLRIAQGFTRITTSGSALDYDIEMISQPRYLEIGYKRNPAPWPIACWYNPTMPLGNLFFYQTPNTSAELHLFSDTILTNLPSLTTPIVMPQGYSRFLKWLLAKELAPEYGKTWTAQMESNLKEARTFVEALNENPAVVSRYDSAITKRRGIDAGWYLHGGFR